MSHKWLMLSNYKYISESYEAFACLYWSPVWCLFLLVKHFRFCRFWWNGPSGFLRESFVKSAACTWTWFDSTWLNKSLRRAAHEGQTRSWSCSGLWRATSWVWCQWTSVTTERSPPPAPSMLTSASGTWSLENRSSPWMRDQVRTRRPRRIVGVLLIDFIIDARNDASCSSVSKKKKSNEYYSFSVMNLQLAFN